MKWQNLRNTTGTPPTQNTDQGPGRVSSATTLYSQCSVDNIHTFVLHAYLRTRLHAHTTYTPLCIHVHVRASLHVYMRTRLHAPAYMLADTRLCLYLLTCIHSYMRPHVNPHWTLFSLDCHICADILNVQLSSQKERKQRAAGSSTTFWFAVTAYMPTCLHVLLRASLLANMLTRLHACMRTCLNAYALKCTCVHEVFECMRPITPQA